MKSRDALGVAALVFVVLLLLSFAKSANAADAFAHFSAIRAYAGLPAVRQDPALQAEAQRRVDNLAARGWNNKSKGRRGLFRRRIVRGSNHPRGRRVGSREGVGYDGGNDPLGKRFYSCSMNATRYRFAGAATAVRGGYTYYCLIWR